MNNKGVVFSAYIYVLLVFFLLSLASLLLVLSNTKRLSDKIKEGAGGIVDQDNSNFSIDLTGDSTVYIALGDTYSEPGFVAADKDGNPLEVVISSDLDVWKAGTYTIKYYTKYNNLDKIVTRKVVVMKNRIGEKVYGVAWNGTGSTLTRTDDSVGLTYTVNNGEITSDFDNAEIYKDIEEVTDTYGNVFVKIPKFYIKKTTDGTKWAWQISSVKKDANYYLPACFYDFTNSVELPYVLVGKYDANLGTGNKLESKPGKAALSRKSIDEFRTYARANNTGGLNGYQLIDIHVMDILQVLFYVEFATLDSQSVMKGFTKGDANYAITGASGTTITLDYPPSEFKVGQMIAIGNGVPSDNIASNLRIKSISGNNITYETIPGISTVGTIAAGQYVFNIAYLSGTTDSIDTPSGFKDLNMDGKNTMRYRYIENLYGNGMQIIDGINFNNTQAYIALNANLYQTGLFSGAYSPIGYLVPENNNYIAKMGYDPNYKFLQLPTEVTNTYANSPYKDRYTRDYSGSMMLLFGGDWMYSSESEYLGITFYNLLLPGLADIRIGTRLVKKAL